MKTEHQRLESKESWRDEHLKWVCAFANSDGGTLVIGRNDEGRAVGVPGARKLLEDLPNKARDLLGVANAFFRAGEIEAWGRGIERLFKACRLGGAPEPNLGFDAGGLWTEFVFDDAYLRILRGSTSAGGDPVTDLVTDPVTDPVDQVVRQLAAGPLQPAQLMAALGLKHRPTFRANCLRPALLRHWVEMTLPDKPNSRLQQYRLTDAGRARLRILVPPEQAL